jgi:protein-arginine kinase activator protein McsA
MYFNDIAKMQEFYITFIDDINQSSDKKSIKQLTIELNTKLNDYIKIEKYEDAARIRDYMFKNGIKRIKK